MFKGVKGIVFDLDGTLIDSSQGILDSLFKAMDFYSIKPAVTKLDSHFFMGKTLKETLAVLIPSGDPELSKKVGDYYVSHYYDNYMQKAVTFAGVAETIKTLNKKGYLLAVGTAKHTYCAVAELDSTGIKKYFTTIMGTEGDMPAKPNPELLLSIAKTLKLNKDELVMVGDTDRDVLMGKNAGVKTIAVTYGNWSRKRFMEENIIPDIFIDEFEELIPYF